MKKIAAIMPLLAFFCLPCLAQIIVSDSLAVAPEGYVLVDSVLYTPIERYNTELSKQGLLGALPSNLEIRQSDDITNAALSQIQSNGKVQTDGYRIRIYFDNRQDAREVSLQTEQQFKRLFPGYSTYRTFQNPFFKVTVGDFRSKVDAQIALRQISKSFPTAFIVKEKMRFPVISEKVRVRVDTVRMLVPIVAGPVNNEGEEL